MTISVGGTEARVGNRQAGTGSRKAALSCIYSKNSGLVTKLHGGDRQYQKATSQLSESPPFTPFSQVHPQTGW